MTTPRLYGIKNCDTVKKARRWLEETGIEYEFSDFRQDGINAQEVKAWLDEVGPGTLLNKRSTTYKNLSDEQKQQAEQGELLSLLLEQPTLIKRPVLTTDGAITVGFKADQYASLFNT
ncbi:ArsC family reductase [Gilvimarinus xylanilyticus]|uniref:ArsC family reductase n=1 Tax=Gilvimarinus xylanilyticus TaxID=2944139 RepID=A0A9X2KSU9_9GAMM|nr:ArsC family reductase [Gilvimarinus xylanilyticus]MCP8898619.1 ArsC family reductase [Gilvimarinus xylanilyticus]